MERKGASYSIKATRPASHHGEHTQKTQVSGMDFKQTLGPTGPGPQPMSLNSSYGHLERRLMAAQGRPQERG